MLQSANVTVTRGGAIKGGARVKYDNVNVKLQSPSISMVGNTTEAPRRLRFYN